MVMDIMNPKVAKECMGDYCLRVGPKVNIPRGRRIKGNTTLSQAETAR